MARTKTIFVGKKSYWKRCPHCKSKDTCYKQRKRLRVLEGKYFNTPAGQTCGFYSVECVDLNRISQDAMKTLNSILSKR